MTISPNISALLNVIAAVVGVLVNLSAEFTTVFGSGTTALIIGVATMIGAVVNAVLHSVSAPTAGLLASKQR